MKQIKIVIGKQEAKAILSEENNVREAIWNALPIEGDLHYAKIEENEVFFIVPLFLKLEIPRPVIFERGTIAYWPNRQFICIYYGERSLPLFGYFILAKITENLEGIKKEGEEVKHKQGKKVYICRG